MLSDYDFGYYYMNTEIVCSNITTRVLEYENYYLESYSNIATPNLASSISVTVIHVYTRYECKNE